MTNKFLRNAISTLEIDDGIIAFRRLKHASSLRSHFTAQEWENMFPFHSELADFSSFCATAGELMAFYEVTSMATHKPIGFLMAFIDEERKPGTVSLHGGGWLRSLGASRLFLRAYRLMAETLAKQAIKVHTSTRRDLQTVLRFNRRAGFIPYRYGNDRVFQRFKINFGNPI